MVPGSLRGSLTRAVPRACACGVEVAAECRASAPCKVGRDELRGIGGVGRAALGSC